MKMSKIDSLAKVIAEELRDQSVNDSDWNLLKENVMRLLGNRVRVVSDYIDTKGRECTMDVIYVAGSPAYLTATKALIESGAKFTVIPLTVTKG